MKKTMLLFAMVLSGCGGGGGGSTPAPSVDQTPNNFSFATLSGFDLDEPATSENIQVSGINASTGISVSGGEYSVNGAAYTSNSGNVNNGDSIRVRLQTSAEEAAESQATLTIGGVSADFTVTTRSADDLIEVSA
ncbi:MAG: hypothetical protein OIF34_06070, partial [Porticoccaceae bacterium]|nr:hypothetical protein [Porticoccaceae bacterium]